jgi:hypothetical protein
MVSFVLALINLNAPAVNIAISKSSRRTFRYMLYASLLHAFTSYCAAFVRRITPMMNLQFRHLRGAEFIC